MLIFQDKTLLVTGGTGSMGKVFIKRALSGECGIPKKIIILSRDEAKQYAMITGEFKDFIRHKVLDFRIGDIRNYSDVVLAVKDADIVVNAAALKQVPSCEYYPEQAIQTNCLGASNIVKAITEHNFPVETVVGISTDKACKPVNVMGMSKALQERIFIAGNIQKLNTRFICVRYGNVLASRGSVIPLFREQIRNGGPVTLTEPLMTRFLLSLNEAVDLVFDAISNAERGETYIPIVPSATVENLALALIGFRNISINNIGIRPGEKIHEVLISEEETFRTIKKKNRYVILPSLPELKRINLDLSIYPKLEGEYSSSGFVLNLEDTGILLERHGLLDLENTKEEELLK